ncbi:hypothetical protein ACFU8W_38635 [Streptomyces sp. NPDC057565]|uniref:hypothetical protein n=1 Tax=Streptomyces sp. NPDC057565 TaxID=3346169 RepID=UPI003698356C
MLLQLDPALALRWAPDDPVAQTWPESQEPVKLVTARANLKQLRLALGVMLKHGLFTPDADGWERVKILMSQPQNRDEKLKGAELAPGTLRGRAQQLKSLWQVRTVLHRPELLGTEPFDGRESTLLFGSGPAPRRNRTRPHEDVGRCLGFVAWVFDHIAPDILAHSRWWAENTVAPGDGVLGKEEGYAAMTNLLYEVKEDTGALPGRRKNGRVALAHQALGLLLGCPDADEAFFWGRFAMRRFSPDDLDVDGGNPCPLPITELPLRSGEGAAPWTRRLLPTRDELQMWQSALVYYAMYYLGAVCGLRDKDLACVPFGSVTRTTKKRPTDEEYEVIEMRGYKSKNRLAPQPTKWKINARIARVIECIEELHEILKVEPTRSTVTGERVLFDSQLITASVRASRETVHLDLNFMNWLINGAERLYASGVAPARLADVTKVNITQVRITALQAYAARPLGNALAAHFGQWNHKSVAMGYHADVFKIIHLADPKDAVELQHEYIGRVLHSAALDPDDLRGKGVPRLLRVIEREGPALSNPAPYSTARAIAAGRRNSNIAVGPYTICVYGRDGAMCGGDGAADFRLCRPFECRNSAMTKAQRARSELRRRIELEMDPALHRSALKFAAAMPEVVDDFTGMTDDELVRVIAVELEGYLVAALGLKP